MLPGTPEKYAGLGVDFVGSPPCDNIKVLLTLGNCKLFALVSPDCVDVNVIPRVQGLYRPFNIFFNLSFDVSIIALLLCFKVSAFLLICNSAKYSGFV